MSKKQPIIIQFESDDNYITVVDLVLFNMGLERTKYALGIDESRKLLEEINTKKLNPDIALVASYLGKGIDDGAKLTKRLKEYSPNVKVIAYTEDDEAKWGDYLSLKSTDAEETSLIAILEKLTGTGFNFDNSKA